MTNMVPQVFHEVFDAGNEAAKFHWKMAQPWFSHTKVVRPHQVWPQIEPASPTCKETHLEHIPSSSLVPVRSEGSCAPLKGFMGPQPAAPTFLSAIHTLEDHPPYKLRVGGTEGWNGAGAGAAEPTWFGRTTLMANRLQTASAWHLPTSGVHLGRGWAKAAHPRGAAEPPWFGRTDLGADRPQLRLQVPHCSHGAINRVFRAEAKHIKEESSYLHSISWVRLVVVGS